MNYEEVLESRDARALRIAKLPIGTLYKKLVDKKYANVLKINDGLLNNMVFEVDLDYECKFSFKLNNRHLLRFSPIYKSQTVCGLSVEQGSFESVADMLINNPSIVATPHFIRDMISDILEVTSYLHSQNIYHVCYSPETVLCRKSSSSILLLTHGSFYLNCRRLVFGNYADYIAPEVLNGGEIDERTDIYSIGKFIEALFSTSEMPLQYRKVINKSTQEDPNNRYQSVKEMRNDLKIKGVLFKSLVITVVLLAILLVGGFIWYDTQPDTSSMEYVKPNKEPEENLLDDGFDPKTELGVISGDSSIQLTPEQIKEQKEYQAKAEAIFRKQFTKGADAILSKIYNTSYMSASEKKFTAASQSTTNELVKLQMDLGQKADLSDATSQRIASEIIEKLTAQKMNELKK